MKKSVMNMTKAVAAVCVLAVCGASAVAETVTVVKGKTIYTMGPAG